MNPPDPPFRFQFRYYKKINTCNYEHSRLTTYCMNIVLRAPYNPKGPIHSKGPHTP